jgi:hypothetical protein
MGIKQSQFSKLPPQPYIKSRDESNDKSRDESNEVFDHMIRGCLLQHYCSKS